MKIEWDVPITMDDGLVLRADVYRPDDDGRYPVLVSYGPYGKGLSFQEGYKTAWDLMAQQHPDAIAGSSNLYQSWEVADPEKWVPHGYALVRVDSRGAGRSPGVIDVHSPRETEDIVQCIEWAGQQSWSSGRVGMSGISYFACNQWATAARRPKHLHAICVWEGYTDRYRDSARHGGILCTFLKHWADMQVKNVQHGLGDRGRRSLVTGELVAGPDTLSDVEMAANRFDRWPTLRDNEMVTATDRGRTAKLDDIQVPLLSCGNWGGQGLHLRGNVEGFERSGSAQKWLQLHMGTHWAIYYTDYGVRLQREFFDHFLKDVDNGWDKRPPVQLQVRHLSGPVVRQESEWPIARTRWTKFYFHPDGSLQPDRLFVGNHPMTYEPLGQGQRFVSPPFERETEITGPSAVRLVLSSASTDADVFIVLHLIDREGEEQTFQGALDPHAPLGQGWLRASHRKLDSARAKSYQPYHSHDEKWPLIPNEPVGLDIEVLPTSIVVPVGYRIAVSVLGRDYENEVPAVSLSNIKHPMRGCGPFLHDEPTDRPPEVFGVPCTIHLSGSDPSYVLLPIVPAA